MYVRHEQLEDAGSFCLDGVGISWRPVPAAGGELLLEAGEEVFELFVVSPEDLFVFIEAECIVPQVGEEAGAGSGRVNVSLTGDREVRSERGDCVVFLHQIVDRTPRVDAPSHAEFFAPGAHEFEKFSADGGRFVAAAQGAVVIE